ncbi:acetyl-CoA carboxylase biotin carboxylase subunit [Arhodomonas aquaeolei]|uniref:acetyl-CoA carboxylase biotin carboxylase subunit n=1 Tax=Arhodomonas aquaeolei TaxID=2369 RepID=UPI000366F023|nr:biotin carboxylase N-terminal domain-containing protein [Arhodomonas aquaeolei]
MGDISKVLIANRGEIACRIARSCRSLGIASVAVCSEADEDALHVRLADEHRVVGPARAQHSYLNIERLMQAASETGADAVHPGYGFLAESTRLADAVTGAGMTWIGPRTDSIRDMGDKARARHIAERAGVPVLPGSRRFTSDDLDDLETEARRIGLPVLVKASAGGGGIGMQRVDDLAALRKVVQSTQGLAKSNFGDEAVFLEKFVPRARHVEVQVLGLGGGRAAHLFERECSIQRRYQKIIEEAPSPAVDAAVRERMTHAAVSLAEAQDYHGAGTVEFVLDDETGEFYFLEMNTRVQVEHPVTEMITGEDIVAHQIRIAAGKESGLSQAGIESRGHAMEFRLYAEDPFNNFLPQPGVIETLHVPAGEHVRVDTGYDDGSRVHPYYDPLIAKVIVRGADRDETRERALEVLRNSRIEGIRTNLPFLVNVLRTDAFRRGETLTSFIADYESELLNTE